MTDHNKILRSMPPGDQQHCDIDEAQTNPFPPEHVETQANDQDSTTITTNRPLKLPLRTTTTKPLAPSLLSPFNPFNAELVGHDRMKSQAPAEPIARGLVFEQGAMRAMETTIHLAQIVRMSTMAVADEEKESDEVTIVAKGKGEEGDGTEERQKVEDKEEAGEWGQVNGGDVTGRHKSIMFKRGLETLDEGHFQLGGDTGAVIAPGSGKHSTLGCLSDPDRFETPRQAPNALVSPSTVVPATVRRVRGIDNLRALSE
ncbi:hypothetical protein KCU67_g8078, partial [Aureobasidium melanogenum]